MNDVVFQQGEETSFVCIVIKGDIELIRRELVEVEDDYHDNELMSMIDPRSPKSRNLAKNFNKNFLLPSKKVKTKYTDVKVAVIGKN